MTQVVEGLRYTDDDEWLRIEDSVGTVGITDYAQDALSDIVYLELPAVGDEFAKGETFGIVESVKAAADLTMPVAGTVTEVNEPLLDEPELLNEEPYGAGWLVKIEISDAAQVNALMDSAAYETHLQDRD